ncbi:MAG: hypothetical protein GY940_18400 [bacterium]|nr:hypothetical protein [bacterium]
MIKSYNKLSLFFPTTFYNLACSELSGRGYGNYSNFYTYLQKFKRDFTRHYIDHEYYGDPKKIVSFIKDDENLFRGVPRSPVNFVTGIAFTIAQILFLLPFSYLGFKKNLYALTDKKKVKAKDLDRDFFSHIINAIIVGVRTGLRDLLHRFFSGQYHTKPGKNSPSPLSVFMNDRQCTGTRRHHGYVYLCHPSHVPGDTTGGNFLSFIARSSGLTKEKKKELFQTETFKKYRWKSFYAMDNEEQVEVFCTGMRYIKGKIFLADRTCKDVDYPCLIQLKDALRHLADQGATVIYLSPEKTVDPDNTLKPERDFIELEGWDELVDSYRIVLKEEGR